MNLSSGDEVTLVELGGARRRWWPYVAGVVAVWVLVALVFGGGGGDDDPVAAPTTPTTDDGTTTTTERRRPPRTSTTLVPPGQPVLGFETGWHLVVGGAGDLVVTDLDTGEQTQLPGADVLGALPGGILTTAPSGRVQWRTYPFDAAAAVDLGRSGGGVWLVDDEHVWLQSWEGGSTDGAELRLVRLDGSVVSTFDSPGEAWPVGVAGGRLVLSAGGDAFLLDADARVERIADGIPMGAFGDEVVLQQCDDQARCRSFAHDVRTGQRREVESTDFLSTVAARSPALASSVGLAVRYDPTGSSQELVLVDADGLRPALPAGTVGGDVWGASWSPDGRLLFVPMGSEVLVVDPFADGGPVEVTSIPSRGSYQVAVVAVP